MRILTGDFTNFEFIFSPMCRHSIQCGVKCLGMLNYDRKVCGDVPVGPNESGSASHEFPSGPTSRARQVTSFGRARRVSLDSSFAHFANPDAIAWCSFFHSFVRSFITIFPTGFRKETSQLCR